MKRIGEDNKRIEQKEEKRGGDGLTPGSFMDSTHGTKGREGCRRSNGNQISSTLSLGRHQVAPY